MKENIKNAFSEHIKLTETELLILSESLITKHYKKGEYFIKEKDFCDYVGFVDKGLFNFFYLIDGVDHIRGFFFYEWLYF